MSDPVVALQNNDVRDVATHFDRSPSAGRRKRDVATHKKGHNASRPRWKTKREPKRLLHQTRFKEHVIKLRQCNPRLININLCTNVMISHELR